jgi:photosystem II stability/assembly factor-like uncharacterized protein
LYPRGQQQRQETTGSHGSALLFCILLIGHSFVGQVQQSLISAESFTVLPGIHIRALEAPNDSTAWFAGSRGVWGYTRDGGKHWHVDSLRLDSVSPQFRSITLLNDSTALLLCIASPAYLLKTTDRGRSWKVVYKNSHKDIFFDSMVFRDKDHGFALADPLAGCFQLLETKDGGDTWKHISCDRMPPALEGEACFAASNTNLLAAGKEVWFVTGGKETRLFRSADGGKTFGASLLPLPRGGTMTGAYSVDFYKGRSGVAAGGNYEKTDTSIVSFAWTADGGRSWKAMKFKKPFFGSCVRFRGQDEVFVTGHDGTYLVRPRSGLATELLDSGANPLKYFTLRIAPGGRFMWLAGSHGRIARAAIGNLR